MLFWKNGVGDRNVYDLFSAKFNVVDQYLVEHVHSGIGRQTKVILMSRCDKKVLGIFAFSETQSNWQSSRTWCLADSN